MSLANICVVAVRKLLDVQNCKLHRGKHFGSRSPKGSSSVIWLIVLHNPTRHLLILCYPSLKDFRKTVLFLSISFEEGKFQTLGNALQP